MTAPLDPTGLFRALNAAEVRYVVLGGIAVIAHGVIRATKDLDICPDPALDNLGRLAALLAAIHAVQDASGDFAAEELPFDPTDPDSLWEGGNFRLQTDLGALDIMQWVPGIDGDSAYPVLAQDAVSTDAEGEPIRVCSLVHLRVMKTAASRPQDLQDLADLAAAHGDEAPQG